MSHMIGQAIFGLIIGRLARLLGLVGAWLGGVIGRATGTYGEGHPAGFFMALLGAVIMLWVCSGSARTSSRKSLRRI